jgi:hypothetical protein
MSLFRALATTRPAEGNRVMFHLNQYEAHKVRADEIRRDFRRATPPAEIRQQPGDRRPFYAAVLAGAGRVLVDLGSRLQRQYGSLVEEVQQAAEADFADGDPRPSTFRKGELPRDVVTVGESAQYTLRLDRRA